MDISSVLFAGNNIIRAGEAVAVGGLFVFLPFSSLKGTFEKIFSADLNDLPGT